MVQVLVLAHLKHLLPLSLGHLALDALGRLLLLPHLLAAKLPIETSPLEMCQSRKTSTPLTVAQIGTQNKMFSEFHQKLLTSQFRETVKRGAARVRSSRADQEFGSLFHSYPRVGGRDVTGQEGQSVGQLSNSQSFQSPQTLRLGALRSAYPGTGLSSQTWEGNPHI